MSHDIYRLSSLSTKASPKFIFIETSKNVAGPTPFSRIVFFNIMLEGFKSQKEFHCFVDFYCLSLF